MVYNPLDNFYKTTVGAVAADKELTFRVKGDFDSVVFVIRKDDETQPSYYRMSRKNGFFEISITLDSGLYWYYFDLCDGRFVGFDKSFEGKITGSPDSFQLTVYDAGFVVPDWLKGGIIYQIFPDRFYASEKEKKIETGKVLHKVWGEAPVYEPDSQGKIVNNDFFGGDFRGITEKLPYLYSLGVTAIYLNPVFRAYSNHRYDTGDFMEFDPLLGTENDFKELIKEAEKYKIKIILDGVFNHTGDDSLYFNKYGRYSSVGAYQSKDSEYYKWFKFTDYPDKYESWWGIATLPTTDKNNKNYINFITGENGVLEKYTGMGVGGWRLDVVDELPDHFVKSVRKAVKAKNPDAIIIGEVWEDASNKISYGVRRKYFQGKELDSVMNYPLKNAILGFVLYRDSKTLSYTVKEQRDHYPKEVLDSLMNILSTHDTCRLLSAVSGVNTDGMSKEDMAKTVLTGKELENAKFRLKVATLLQFTLCGVPSIYYGDEAGMQGFKDPLNRGCFPWEKEDKDIFNWYVMLSEIRRENPVFADGEYKELYVSDGIFAFKRRSDASDIAVVINISDKELGLDFDGELKDIVSGREFREHLDIKPDGFAVLAKIVEKSRLSLDL